MFKSTRSFARPIVIALTATISFLCVNTAAQAEIVRIEIKDVAPAFGGKSFGTVGKYDLIKARAYGEVDPGDAHNASIADIELAPVNARGKVEYSTDVEILRPANVANGNHRLFFEVLNRGNKLALGNFNDAPSGNELLTPEMAGSGFLFERGYTVVWAGWQSGKNVAAGKGRLMAQIPEAHSKNGGSLTGQIIMSQIFNNMQDSKIPLLFAVADRQARANKVLIRNNSTSKPVELPHGAWTFVDDFNVKIDRSHTFLADYDAGAQYDVIYTAKDPDVSGLGYAITRDIVSFLKNNETDNNPLAGSLHYALAHGTSQSGRMLKGFIHDGFNEDETGRVVFEGVNPNISGAHSIVLNERFGDANATGRAYERHANAAIEFPFTYGSMKDPLTEKTDGILVNCSQSNTCPK
ncbi:MAG: alpha/beta hydrolase domain-containing protein, partial [Phyllobacterium sp.]